MNEVHVLYCIARKEALSTSTYCYASGNCEEELPKKPVGRLSADSRPTVGRLSADSRPTVGRLSTDRELFFTITMQADIKKIEKNLKCLRDEKEKATSCVQYNCNIVLLQEVLK